VTPPVPGRQTAPAPSLVAPSTPAAPLPHYRCDNDIAFDVRFADDSAQIVFASREPETVLRDAGGVTPEETVYSSTKLKAVFGLEPQGRGAKLHFASPPLEARCVRDLPQN
jgi:hypothetical protein